MGAADPRRDALEATVNNPPSQFQEDLFPELISHSGHGSGSAMAAMLRKRREVAVEPVPCMYEAATAESMEQIDNVTGRSTAGDHGTE
jgi:hypothetical protein